EGSSPPLRASGLNPAGTLPPPAYVSFTLPLCRQGGAGGGGRGGAGEAVRAGQARQAADAACRRGRRGGQGGGGLGTFYNAQVAFYNCRIVCKMFHVPPGEAPVFSRVYAAGVVARGMQGRKGKDA